MTTKGRLALHAIALFMLALLIRLPGIGWGLPNDLRNQSLHPDELIIYNFSQEIEPFRLHFVPNNYNYPTLYPTMLRLFGDAAVMYTDTPDPLRESRQLTPQRWLQLAAHQRMFHLVGRVLSCLAGAAFALVCFLFLYRRTLVGAWFSGLFAALAPVLVVNSRWQTVDMTAAAFFVASILLATWILEAEDEGKITKLALGSAAFAGLSAGTKYVGILALVSLAAALVIKRPRNFLKVGGASLGTALLVFLITTPGAVLNWERFRFSFAYEMAHTRQDRGQVIGDIIFAHTPSGFLYQLQHVVLGSAPAAAIAGLLALLYLAAKGRRWTWVILAGLIPIYLVVGRAEIKFSRYAIPLFMGSAVGFGSLVGAFARRPKMGAAVVGAAGLSLIGLEGPLEGLRGTVQYTAWMRGQDPRDEAARYMLARAAGDPQSTVGLIRQPWYYSVPVFPDANYSFHIPAEALQAMLAATQSPHVVFPIGSPLPDYVAETDLETRHARRLRGATDLTPAEQATRDQILTVTDTVDKNYRVDRQFGLGPKPYVDDMLYIQPTVTIYDRISP